MTAPDYASRPVLPPRPRTVTAGIVIVSIGVVLGFFLLLAVFTLTPPTANLDAVRAGLLVSAFVILGNAVGAVLIMLGYGWARFLLIATGVIGIVSAFIAGGGLTFGDALYALAIVLFFVPQSSQYFAARAAVRAAR